jgi:hypothetical protein
MIPTVSRIAGQCCAGRQKYFQPWAVLTGSMGGVHGLRVSLLPNLVWAFPGGKGCQSDACERVCRTSETINRPPNKNGGQGRII